MLHRHLSCTVKIEREESDPFWTTRRSRRHFQQNMLVRRVQQKRRRIRSERVPRHCSRKNHTCHSTRRENAYSQKKKCFSLLWSCHRPKRSRQRDRCPRSNHPSLEARPSLSEIAATAQTPHSHRLRRRLCLAKGQLVPAREIRSGCPLQGKARTRQKRFWWTQLCQSE